MINVPRQILNQNPASTGVFSAIVERANRTKHNDRVGNRLEREFMTDLPNMHVKNFIISLFSNSHQLLYVYKYPVHLVTVNPR